MTDRRWKKNMANMIKKIIENEKKTSIIEINSANEWIAHNGETCSKEK